MLDKLQDGSFGFQVFMKSIKSNPEPLFCSIDLRSASIDCRLDFFFLPLFLEPDSGAVVEGDVEIVGVELGCLWSAGLRMALAASGFPLHTFRTLFGPGFSDWIVVIELHPEHWS